MTPTQHIDNISISQAFKQKIFAIPVLIDILARHEHEQPKTMEAGAVEQLTQSRHSGLRSYAPVQTTDNPSVVLPDVKPSGLRVKLRRTCFHVLPEVPPMPEGESCNALHDESKPPAHPHQQPEMFAFTHIQHKPAPDDPRDAVV